MTICLCPVLHLSHEANTIYICKKCTVKTVSKLTSFYRFIVLNLSFYRCEIPN